MKQIQPDKLKQPSFMICIEWSVWKILGQITAVWIIPTMNAASSFCRLSQIATNTYKSYLVSLCACIDIKIKYNEWYNSCFHQLFSFICSILSFDLEVWRLKKPSHMAAKRNTEWTTFVTSRRRSIYVFANVKTMWIRYELAWTSCISLSDNNNFMFGALSHLMHYGTAANCYRGLTRGQNGNRQSDWIPFEIRTLKIVI